jgi:CRP-like cAMP-binding protein
MPKELFSNTEDYVSFKAGQLIFKEGESGKFMYVIIEGEVDVIVGGKHVDTVGAGKILGEMALIDTGPRSATAISKTDCKVVPISRAHFIYLVQQRPNFALEVMRVMADRLRRMNALL